MDWANERWVRLYTRDTTTWKMLDWRARTVLMHLLRKVDRAGVLEVGDTGTMGLAAVLELPLEVVEPGIERLLHQRLRVVVETPTAYVLPNFLDAQEAVQTTNHRSSEYRARKRDYALAAAKPAIAELVRLPAPARAGDDVTPRDGVVTSRDASVTRGHATSQHHDPGISGRADLPAEADPPSSSTVTKRDADTTPRDETVTPHHAASQRVTPILSDPKDLSPSARAISGDGGQPGSGQTGPHATQQGAATPGHGARDRAAQDRAERDPAAGNVAEPQLDPTGHRVERPPSPGPSREDIARTMPTFDPAAPLAIGRLAEAVWLRVSDASIEIATELKLPAPLPFPAIAPSTNRKGFVELRQRIREEGELAPVACDRVVDNTVKLARARRSIEWLSEKLFGENAWINARNGIDPSARSTAPAGQRAASQSPAPKPRVPVERRAPDPELTDEERAELAELANRLAVSPAAGIEYEQARGRAPSGVAATSAAVSGESARAPPASSGPNDTRTDSTHRRRKASNT